jgi:hypothetical protein
MIQRPGRRRRLRQTATSRAAIPFLIIRHPVGAPCGSREQLRLLISGRTGGQPLERVPNDLVAAPAFLHREIALVHRAFRSERLDAGLHPRPPRLGDLLRTRRQFARATAMTGKPDRHCTQLHVNVLVPGNRGDAGLPFGEHLVAPAGVWPAQNRRADMVEDDRCLGNAPANSANSASSGSCG